MGLFKCKECGREVSTHEKICPICGASVNNGRNVHYFYAFAAVILILTLGTEVYDFVKKQKEQERRVQAAIAAQLEKKKQQEIEKEIKRAEAKRRRIDNEIKRAKELEKAKKDFIVFKNYLFDMFNNENIKIVRAVYLNEDLPQEVIIMMEPIWHIRNKHLRKNDATIFWKLWASINTPNNPDHARIKLVSINKDRVGGSRVWAGSLIWVED